MQLAANDPADCPVGSEEHSNRVVLLRSPSWEKRRKALGGTKRGCRRGVSAVATSEDTLPANELPDRGIEETQLKKTTYPSKELDYWGPSIKEDNPMITNPFQGTAYDAVAAALPFAVDPRKITER
jgi:hypothetical protein